MNRTFQISAGWIKRYLWNRKQ